MRGWARALQITVLTIGRESTDLLAVVNERAGEVSDLLLGDGSLYDRLYLFIIHAVFNVAPPL